MLCCAAGIMRAQPVYQKSDNLIGLGLGVGGAYNIDASDYETPLFNVSYERGMWSAGWDQVQGVVSLGALVGRKRSGLTQNILNGSLITKKRYTVIGLRSAFHVQNYFGHELRKWDLYGGIMLGAYFTKTNITNNIPPPFTREPVEKTDLNMSFSGFVGARYFFNEHWAVCGETGFGYTNFLIGAGYRF